jgi:type IV pilus assembly protein PilA
MAMLAALRVRRPFSNVHWSLLAVLIALWEFLLFGQPCHEGPRYFGVALVATTVMLTLWTSHIRNGAATGWRQIIQISGGALYDLVALLILLIIVALPLAVMTPTYQCYTAKAKVSEMLLYASTLREKVEEHAKKDQSLANSGKDLEVKEFGRMKGGLVTKEGTIVTVSDDPAAVIMLVPTLNNGAISWKCVGYPAKSMPMSCRDK